MVDGPEKVSGRAKYTADLVLPAMLAGRIFRSPYSHAEILDVDVSEAAKLPGVKAIVTGAQCDQTFGVLPVARTEHVLARERVRYRGEPLAAIAAIDMQRPRKRCAGSSSRSASFRPITACKTRWRRTPSPSISIARITLNATYCSN